MQLTSRYLVSNRTNIIANEAGFITEYRPVYNRTLQVYKGIDNVLEFRLYNADQRPINTNQYTPKFLAFDENNTLVLEKDGIVLDDGSTSTKGLFTVTVSENDLLNVKQQYLKYNIYMIDSNNEKVLTYSHSNFDNDATIFVNARTFPGPLETYEIKTFQQTGVDTNEWFSETIDAQPGINGNEALHTAAIYTNGYVGTVEVQATLDNQISDGTTWTTVGTLGFVGSETEPTPINFNGVFSHLRFYTDANPADKISKILVRN